MRASDHSTTTRSPRPPVVVPEDDVVFRLAQLLLLMGSMAQQGRRGVPIERLSYYDFFVANPLLVVTDDEDPDRMSLLMAGFDSRALHYASPTHRFTTRRERLQHDLAILVSYGLVVPTVDKAVRYSVTSSGSELASRFTAVYARAYRTSADILIRRLHKLSDSRLREQARRWTTFEDTAAWETDGALFDLELLRTDNPDTHLDGRPM